MKGIVFTEFLTMIEQQHGYDLVDELLVESDLPSGGIYTAVGTYAHSEMVTLVSGLSQKTQTPLPNLLKAFGRYLFGTFKKGYPAFLSAAGNAFDFLESIEKYIHVEVRKLYPDAELPRFQTRVIDEKTLEMIYHSDRRMADFAEGLIESSLEHYNEPAEIQREDVERDGSEVRFLICKK
ncbi:MAG: heme NO-binding domain-containing protein [Saprospiraceae bacterium]